MRFPAAQKLRVQADFIRVRQEGLRVECGPFILNALRVPGRMAPARIGVVTGKKMLGDAVHRNRMRRVFREIFRTNLGVWDAGWDVVIVPRRSSLEKKYASLERRYLEASARLQSDFLEKKTPPESNKMAPAPAPAKCAPETPVSFSEGENTGVIANFFALLVRGYQKFISPPLHFFGCGFVGCRFTPTCSEYARQAFLKHGFFKGGWLAARRICRCQPFCRGGHDPVP